MHCQIYLKKNSASLYLFKPWEFHFLKSSPISQLNCYTENTDPLQKIQMFGFGFNCFSRYFYDCSFTIHHKQKIND